MFHPYRSRRHLPGPQSQTPKRDTHDRVALIVEILGVLAVIGTIIIAILSANDAKRDMTRAINTLTGQQRALTRQAQAAENQAAATRDALKVSNRLAVASVAQADAARRQAEASLKNAEAAGLAALASVQSARSLARSAETASRSLQFQQTSYLEIVPVGLTDYQLGRRPKADIIITNVGGTVPIFVEIAWAFELAAFDAPVRSWDIFSDKVVIHLGPGRPLSKSITGMPLDEPALRALAEHRAKIRLMVKANYLDATDETKTLYLCHEWTGSSDRIWPHYCTTPSVIKSGAKADKRQHKSR